MNIKQRLQSLSIYIFGNNFKNNFKNNVIPEIEKYPYIKLKNQNIKELDKILIKQRLKIIMEDVKHDILKKPKLKYIIIENKKTFTFQDLKELTMIKEIKDYNIKYNYRTFNNQIFKKYKPKKYNIQQPRSNKLKSL